MPERTKWPRKMNGSTGESSNSVAYKSTQRNNEQDAVSSSQSLERDKASRGRNYNDKNRSM